jgi:hypothetical protein
LLVWLAPWARWGGGALVGGIAAIRGARTTAESVRRQVQDQAVVEHQQWLRGQRQETYAESIRAAEVFIATCETVMFCANEVRAERMARVVESHENYQTTTSMISLIGPGEVRQASFRCSAASNHLRNALEEWIVDTTDDADKVTVVVERARALVPARSAAAREVLARPLPI